MILWEFWHSPLHYSFSWPEWVVAFTFCAFCQAHFRRNGRPAKTKNHLGQSALNEWDEAENGADECAFKLWHVCIIWSRQSANPSPTVPSSLGMQIDSAAIPFLGWKAGIGQFVMRAASIQTNSSPMEKGSLAMTAIKGRKFAFFGEICIWGDWFSSCI